MRVGIVRPSVWVLGRMIGAAREASQGLIADRLAEQLPLSRRGKFDRLLEVDPELKVSEIMWLRTGRVGVKGALAQVAKYERLVEIQAGHVDLSSLPLSRRRQLAAQARRQPHRGHRQRRRAPLVHARALSRDVQPHPGVLAAPADLPLLTQSGLATTTPDAASGRVVVNARPRPIARRVS